MSEYSQDYAHAPVSAAARKGFFPILVVMVGFTFFSASMWSGGTLGQGLDFQLSDHSDNRQPSARCLHVRSRLDGQ